MTEAWPLSELTEVFLQTVETLPDAEFAAPSALPGWANAHVIAHVHHNAIALGNLVEWARSGVARPMYSSTTQRNADIERSAAESPSRLRALINESAPDLLVDYQRLTDDELASTIETAQGRHLPAREIAWLRCRELGVHATDLGATFDQLPADFLIALVEEITAKRLDGGEAAALAATLTGRTGAGPALGRWL